MTSSPKILLCNGASLPEDTKSQAGAQRLEYREGFPDRNINLQLPRFVRDVLSLSPRMLDLLEIAGYLYSADRLNSRGAKDTLEYHNWARKFKFVIKVRDYEFWSNSNVQEALSEVLVFMSGDEEYRFMFQPGHATPPTSMFDSTTFALPKQKQIHTMLFSGGLDSLAGALELLKNTQDIVCLVSHHSGQPGTIKTQDGLVKALKGTYHSRVRHYKFKCSLVSKYNRAVEETQRTRSFLYSCIAFSICSSNGKNSFHIHENGVTSINFPRRQDAINARTSRTTNPRTLALLQNFFSLVQGSNIKIKTPYLFKTKTDILKIFNKYSRRNLIPSSVSCSKTFQNLRQATHCGGCLQCVDRRLSSYAAKLQDVDESGIYNHDFIRDTNSSEIKTCLIDYIRQAMNFSQSTEDSFYHEYLNELARIAESITLLYPNLKEPLVINKLWRLCKRHGLQINSALKVIQALYDEPYKKKIEDSLLDILGIQPYFQEPVLRLINSICEQLEKSIPVAFEHNQPVNEQDLNDKINSMIEAQRGGYEREHPSINFALTKAIPDHSFEGDGLLIEAKYIRSSTTPSKATEGIAADITKYGSDKNCILFIVYDPDKKIKDVDTFCNDFERKANCVVKIIR